MRKILSRDDAVAVIKKFYSPPDEGIYDALCNFMIVADVLSLETTESCHGHIDWVYPFPSILFIFPFKELECVPLWKLWRRRERLDGQNNARRIFDTAKLRVDAAVYFITNELMKLYKENPVDLELVLAVEKWGPLKFGIAPAFPMYSRGLRDGGKFGELEALLIKQRKEFDRVSQILLAKVNSFSSFDGISQSACNVCRRKS